MSPLPFMTLVAVTCLVAGVASQSQLGNSDISGLLSDSRNIRAQINCLKRTGRCNELGRMLIQAVPEVLNNRCAKCTPTQKTNADKLTAFIQRNYPNDYNEIVRLYSRPNRNNLRGNFRG